MIDRRELLLGTGAALLAAACKRAEQGDRPGVAPPPGPSRPKTLGAGDPIDPGFHAQLGPAGFAFAGDLLLDLDGDTLVAGPLRLAGARSVAVLPDGSVLVLLLAGPTASSVHVVGGREVARHEQLFARRVLATESAAAYWGIEDGYAGRFEVATGKVARDFKLPANVAIASAATAADGALVAPEIGGVLRASDQLGHFALAEAPALLAPATDGRLWGWVRDRVVVLELAGSNAAVKATLSPGADQRIVHFAGLGAHAAAVVARPVSATQAAFSVVCFTTAGEAWRAALPAGTSHGEVVVTPAFVAVRAWPDRAIARLDLATGKPI